MNRQETETQPAQEFDNTPKGLAGRFKAIITSPLIYFENMPLEGGLVDPIIFMAAASGIAALGSTLITMRPIAGIQEFIVRMIFSFVSAGFLMILSRGLGGTGNFEGTYRAFAYASAPAVVLWIPLLNLIAGLYTLFLLRLGIVRAHDLEPKRATIVLGIYMLVMIGFALTMAYFSVAAILSAKSGANAIAP